MKKLILIVSVMVIIALAVGCWWFLGRSNGLIPTEQIATLEITHHNTPTVTATCDKVEQLRYLAGLMNKLELKSVDMPGIRPEFELTFRDAEGRIVTQISVFNRYYLANENGAYTTDLMADHDSVYFYLCDLAQRQDIPVQNPDLALMFLGSLGVLLFVMFFGGVCYVFQLLVCKSTGFIPLRCLPILASSLVMLGFFLNYNVFNVFTAIFIMITFAMKWDTPLIFYIILSVTGLICHILGWRAGGSARKDPVS